MQHFLYPAPLPPPLPPPTSGRGTILSQEARLHALQIAEEIQAERGSYRKWNEVAKEVNRQFGSNVDGDLVKRQVTSMLRSVQRSGLNSVKRPRKHADVIQQLLDPQAKRTAYAGGGTIPEARRIEYRARGEGGDSGGEGGEGSGGGEGEEGEDVINVDDERPATSGDDTSPTGAETTTTESGSAAGSSDEAQATVPSFPKTSSSSTTTTTTTTSTTTSSADSSSTTQSANPDLESTSGTTTTPAASKPEPRARNRLSSGRGATTHTGESMLTSSFGDTHSIERVVHKELKKSSEIAKPFSHFAAPTRILPTMGVDDVYNLISRSYPDIDAEFVRTQEIDGSAFQALTHKELTEFGVSTFGKRNKLLQLCVSPLESHVPPLPPQPIPTPVPQEYFYGRIPAGAYPSPFLEAKPEPDEKTHEGRESTSEKKPPVTKILDLEVVGVRKRYLVEREHGGVEVLTPCKLRKYKNLTSAFEHIHPDKLVPIPAFSPGFTHIHSAPPDDSPKTPLLPPPGDQTTPSSASSTTASSPSASTPSRTSKSGKSKSPAKSAHATPTAASYLPPAYYTMYIPSNMPMPPPYPVMAPPSSSHPHAHPPANLQWVSSGFPGPAGQRGGEKYHSFHPYTPPVLPK